MHHFATQFFERYPLTILALNNTHEGHEGITRHDVICIRLAEAAGNHTILPCRKCLNKHSSFLLAQRRIVGARIELRLILTEKFPLGGALNGAGGLDLPSHRLGTTDLLSSLDAPIFEVLRFLPRRTLHLVVQARKKSRASFILLQRTTGFDPGDAILLAGAILPTLEGLLGPEIGLLGLGGKATLKRLGTLRLDGILSLPHLGDAFDGGAGLGSAFL